MFEIFMLLVLTLVTVEYFFLSQHALCLQVAGQPSAVLIKSHFVPIFSICISLHCSKRSGWESGTAVLQSSILTMAGISDNERDTLIKRHMVCYSTSNSEYVNGFSVVYD